MKHRLVLFFLLSMIPAFSLKAAPEFEASLSNSHIHDGESTLYTIKAKWPRSESYAFLPPNPKTENLSLLRKGESQEVLVENGKEWVLKTFEIEFKAEKPGQAKILAFDLNYLSRSAKQEEVSPENPAQTLGKFASPEQSISVQANQSFSPKLLITASISTVGIGLVLFLILGRKKSSTAVEASPKFVTPQEETLKNIQNISENQGLASKEFLQAVSLQFRDFLIKHFDLSLAPYSESDLIRQLNESEKLIEKTPVRILERINESKYAHEAPNREQALSLTREIIRYIEGTKII